MMTERVDTGDSGIAGEPFPRFLPSSLLRKLSRRSVFWITLANALLVVVFGVFSPQHAFVSQFNIKSMLFDACEIVALSVGEAILMSAAQLDISVGGNVILSSVFGAKAMVSLSGSPAQVQAGHYPHLAVGIAVGVLVCFITACAFGAVNGILVGFLNISPLIATLGTLGIGTGIADVVTNGFDVAYIPSVFQSEFGSRSFWGILPFPAIIVGILCVIAWIVMMRTRFGLNTVAIGSSRTAAVRAGISVRWHVVQLFVIMGFFAGLAALIDFARFATTNVSGHTTDALAALAGAVIGGTSLFGGEVSIGGAVTGACLAVILEVGLIIMNLSAFYQLIVIGAVLIIAVWADQLRRTAKVASAR